MFGIDPMSSDPFDATVAKRTLALLASATDLIDRSETVLPERMTLIIDAMNGHPPGRGFDGDGRGGSATFCEVHDQERCPCGQGTTYAQRSDRTGEQALLPDRAKGDHDRLLQLARHLERDARELESVLARWSKRAPSDVDRSSKDGDRYSCASCSRLHVANGVARWEPAFRALPLSSGAAPTWLCQWCWRWVRSEGSLPPVSSLEQHHKGMRVRKPA